MGEVHSKDENNNDLRNIGKEANKKDPKYFQSIPQLKLQMNYWFQNPNQIQIKNIKN